MVPTHDNEASGRLNVLWISLEDVSPRFGCYSDALARTPNIDAFAAQGTVYEAAFATAPVCSPSRAAVITGQYATSFGAHHHRTTTTDADYPQLPTPYEAVPPPYVRAFPEFLRMAGYFCTNNAKTDYQFGVPASAWDRCGDDAHWRDRNRAQPFFAVFNPMETHEAQMWERADRPLRTDPDRVIVPPYLPDTEAVRRSIAVHYDNIEQADARVGELLRELDDDDLTESTVVFLWSDHGEGLPRGKTTLYDSGTRVPLIVRRPNAVPAGARSKELVSLIDLAPTVLALTGLNPPPYMHGRAFMGPVTPPREAVFAARDRCGVGYDMSRSARDTRYKYIRNYYPEQPALSFRPFGWSHPALRELWRLHDLGELADTQRALLEPRPVEELYDCVDDPHETTNLAEDPEYASILNRLRNAVSQWQREVGDLGDTPESELAERFWPGGLQPRTARPSVIGHTPDGKQRSVVNENRPRANAVTLYCPTHGASITYRIEDSKSWRVYDGAAIPVPADGLTLRVRANRLGWRDSEEVSLRVDRSSQVAVLAST